MTAPTPFEINLDLDAPASPLDPLELIADAIFDLASAVREHNALIHDLNCSCGGGAGENQRGH